MRHNKKFFFRKKKIYCLFLLCVCLLTGCGDDKQSGIYNFAGKEPKEIDPWLYLQDTALSSNIQVRKFASSAGNLGITLGVMGIVFSILYMVIRILFARNGKVKEEIKEEAMMKGLVAIMIFSVPLWLGVCKMVGEMLV